MLPELFLQRMKETLGEEYDAFFESLNQDRFQALRLNPLKKNRNGTFADVGCLEFLSGCRQVPWEAKGYYYDAGCQPGKHPYHEAGVYYIQEPSAMMPVPLLKVNPGERVLDLCAAPGGKSTQIAGYLQGEGLLVCNEINPQRAKILSENIERMGVTNACVTNETPERLAGFFPEYFDRILVDAPCSGEGMFRKNEEAGAEWSPGNVRMCAARQDGILNEAAKMLKPAGTLVYSTCTFAREEDEGSVERFLAGHPEFELLEMKRLWPHKVQGEGHFAAVLKKGGPEDSGYRGMPSGGYQKGISEKDLKKEWGDFAEFFEECFSGSCDSIMGCFDRMTDLSKKIRRILLEGSSGDGKFFLFGENLYLIPDEMPSIKGLKVLRPGLQIGTFKKNRFEPAHAFALAVDPGSVRYSIGLSSKDDRILQYLSGQSFPVEGEKGWYLVCVDGFGTGWGKVSGGMLKNHYPKGLRKTIFPPVYEWQSGTVTDEEMGST